MKKRHQKNKQLKKTKKNKMVWFAVAYVIVLIVTVGLAVELGGIFEGLSSIVAVVGVWVLIAFFITRLNRKEYPKLSKKAQKRFEEESNTEGPADWRQ